MASSLLAHLAVRLGHRGVPGEGHEHVVERRTPKRQVRDGYAGGVQATDLRPCNEARGEVQAASHPTGVRLDDSIPSPCQIESLQELDGSPTSFGLADVIQAADELEVLPAGEAGINRG